MCVDDENAISKKPPLLIAQDTQHTLGVAFSYLEHNNTITETSRKASIFLFFTKKLVLLIIQKEVKPSPESKMMFLHHYFLLDTTTFSLKLEVGYHIFPPKWRWLTRSTHSPTLSSIDKTSHSSQNLKLSIIHFRYGPKTCSHCTKVWHRICPTSEAPLWRSA